MQTQVRARIKAEKARTSDGAYGRRSRARVLVE